MSRLFSRSLFLSGGSWARRWSRRLGGWIATGLKLYGALALLWTSTVRANPVGEQVVGGAANFERVGNSLTIQQGTDRAVINWNNFSIGAGETTKFVMPSASSAALNRVLSGNPSAIYGSLQANGNLFLINPAGIMVGPSGTINAASFLASTHDIDPESFMKGGDLDLLGNSSASILNRGKIEASSGDVFLIAQHIENEGQIMAKDGTVGMVSGTQVSLQAVGPHGFKVRLMDVPDEKAKSKTKEGVANIVNEGVIQAANAVLEVTGNVGSLAINNRGTIRATGVRPNADGTVTLIGGEGDVVNSGVIAALKKNLDGAETGGDIQIAGRNVTAEASSLVTAAGAAGGGNVRMRGLDTTLVSGRVEATGYAKDSQGGRVELLGKNVGIRAGEVNADGGAKGGTVLAGGDYLGLNPEIPNAKATVITPDARISANATVQGDGGKVVAWSDDYTGFFGTIAALGGPEGGNGGFIETSSRNNLQAFGEAQASAAKGLPGQWLLDPSNVIVSDRNTSGGWFSPGNPTIFTPFFVETAYILNTQVNNALNLGTSVTITTGSAATLDCGVITINAPIAKTFGGNATLTLDSDSGITINADITSVSGSLFMDFRADSNGDGFGTFNLAASAHLFSNGGNITVTAGDVVLDGTMNTLKIVQAPVTVNDGGSYTVGTVPTVDIQPPNATGGVEASAIALMGIKGASVTDGGSGYTGVPTIQIVGGGGQNAVLTPLMGVPLGTYTYGGPAGQAVQIAIKGQNYTPNVDTVSILGGGGANATGIVRSVDADGGITSVEILTAGSGYTFLPSANVNGTGTGACIEIQSLTVEDVSVTNPGTGYTGSMVLHINGAGGSGATAQVDTVQVVNLLFDGTSATPDVGAPSYGVGYSAGQILRTGSGEILFTGSGIGGADVEIGAMVNVAGNILLKPSAPGSTIGVGTGTGTFGVSNAEVGRLNVTGSILPGTITVGSRAAGALAVGGLSPGNQNLTLSTGGNITGVIAETGGNNITMAGGLLTLDAAGAIGTGNTAGNGLQINSSRIAVITEGDFFNLYNTAALTQFHVTTDGTVATQRMVDNQPGTTNLNWFVTEAGGNSTIYGITVLQDSVDLRYENSLGDITVSGGGVSSVMINAVNSGATGITFAPPDIPGGVQATATIAAGVVTITNPGSGYSLPPLIGLVGGGNIQNFAGLGSMNCQPANSSVAQVNFRDFALSAPSGNIYAGLPRPVPLFTGGGNLTLTAQDIELPGFNRGSLTLTDITTAALASVAYANLGVLNTFQAVPQIDVMTPVYTAANVAAPTLTYTGFSFGTRVALEPRFAASAGSISGQGGVLTIEATSPSAEGRQVSFSPAGGEVGMNIDVRETALLEAPGIRIGGPRTGDITLTTMVTPLLFQQGVTTRNATGIDNATYSYDPRYFENPFFDATRFNNSPQNVVNDSGVPHVTAGTVSLVSALGEVKNVSGGDVNAWALSLTGIDGVYFDGQSNLGTFAGLSLTTQNGSIVHAISGRVGRTFENTQVGNGGDATYKFNNETVVVNDSRLPVLASFTSFTGSTSSSQFVSSPQEAKATAAITGGKVSSISPDANGKGYLYRAEPLVTITGGGVQEASLRAILDGTGVALVAPQIVGAGYTPSVLDDATGLTTGPDVSIIGNGSGALVGNGGKAFVSDSGIISPFSVLNGGSGYDPAAPPQVIVSGGGSGVTRPAVVRTEVNSAGQVSAIIVVDPGAGYDNSPVSLLIQAPGLGGVRAEGALDNDFRPTTFGNSLNPVYVSNNGSGYTAEPSVAITGGGVRQAQAKALVQLDRSSDQYGQVLGYVITDGGLGYTSTPFVTIGSGQAYGQFGEYGVSTDTVDRNVGSGNITLSGIGAPEVGGLQLNAPVRTGDALGTSGGDAITGSILLDIPGPFGANFNFGGGLFPNPGRARGIVITGDASIIPGASGVGNARSGSVTIVANSIGNDDSSTLTELTGSKGLPIQIGTATGGVSNITGSLNASLEDRTTVTVGVGDLQIYAPAPGQVQAALGNVPLDSNHREVAPRTSNDLYLSGLSTPLNSTDDAGHIVVDESLVTVEVGAFEGKLTLLRRAESQATATVVNGRVTLITPDQGGQLFALAPTVSLIGGGIVPAEASAFVRLGTITAPDGSNVISSGNGLDISGSGYFAVPEVTITGGGGRGATAVAVLATTTVTTETGTQIVPTGSIARIIITDPGFGYTSLPVINIGAPAGVQATATAAIDAGGTPTVTIIDAGLGYTSANIPSVIVTGGILGTATATASVNSLSQIANIQINLNGDIFPTGAPVLTIGPPAGVAQATANLQDGAISSFTIQSAGGGYSSAPTVLLSNGTTTPYSLTLDKLGLFADRLQVFDASTPSSILVEAGMAAVAPWTNQRPVNLGQVQPGASSYVTAELARFLVNDLVVGRRNPAHLGVGAGEFTVSAAMSADNLRVSNGIFLAGTRGLTDLGGATGASFEAASINVGSTVSLRGSGNKIHYLAGIIQGPFEELTFAAPFTLSSGLRILSGISQPLTIGEIFGNPAYFTGERFNQGITTQNGDINLFADLIEQSRLVGYLDTTGEGKYPVGSLTPETFAGSSTVTLAPLTAGRPISIYYNSPGSGLALRIGNPAAPGLEQVRAGAIKIGSATSGAITFNSDFGFNYLTYPEAPRALILETGGSISLGVSQIPPSPFPDPRTSSILVPSLSLTAAGSVSFGAADNPNYPALQPTRPKATDPLLKVSYLAANLTGVGQSLDFTTTQPELTIADFGPLGGATGITTAAGSNVTINVPGNLYVPLMPPQIQTSPANTSVLPSTINSGGNITLNSTVAGGTISIAVVNNFDTDGWNTPTPAGSVINSTIVANSANAVVTVNADRIDIGDNGTNLAPPGRLTPPLIAANLNSGRVILEPLTAGTDIVLGETKGVGFNFTGTELGNIQANVLRVGNSTAGNISVEALIQLDTNRLPGAFSLIGNGTISDLGIASLTGIQYGGGLRLSGNGAISFESLLNQFGTVAANSSGTLAIPHDITLTSTGFFIGTADTLTGINAAKSRVTLQPSSSVPINLGTKTLTTPTVLYAGAYTTAPTMTITAPPAPGTQATATAVMEVGSISISNAGAGYQATPTVQLVDSGGTGVGALAVAVVDLNPLSLTYGQVTAINVTDAGTGYTGPVAVSLTGGNPTQIAAGNATLAMESVNLLNPGSGYTANPLVTLSGGGGSGASVYATSDFSFTDEMLKLVTADTLQIGRNDGALASGTITISSAISLYDGRGEPTAQTLSLWTGAGIISNPAGTAGISVDSLAIRAGGPVQMGGVLNGTTGNTDTVNSVANFAAELSGAGALNFADLSPLTVKQVDSLYGITTAGAVGDDVILTADEMTILEQISTGAGNITLQPRKPGVDISLNDSSNSLQLDNAELGQLSSIGTVTFGRANGTGTFNIGGLGAINLTGGGFSLQLRGQDSDVSFNQNEDPLLGGGITLAANRSFTLDVGSGVVTTTKVPSAITDITIGDGTTGTLVILSAGAFGTSTAPILTSLADLGGADVSGQIYLRNAGSLDLSGDVSAEGPLYLSSSDGTFTNSGHTITTTSGTLTLEGDTMNLTGGGPTIFGTSAGIFLQPYSPSQTIGVFDGAFGAFEINSSEFSLLAGTSPVTIGRADGTGDVNVNAQSGIDRNLTIQAGAMGPGGTFSINGAISSNGTDIVFNAYHGQFTAGALVDLSQSGALTTGSLVIYAQTINLPLAPAVNLWANGGITLGNPDGDTYVNVPGLHPGALTINGLDGIRTDGFVNFGSPVGGSSVFLGTVNLTGVGGLGMFAGTGGQIQLQDNITSTGTIYIDGSLTLSRPGTTTITSGGSVFVINGIQTASTQTLSVSAGDFTLASNVNPANLAGSLDLNAVSGQIFLGMTASQVPVALQNVYASSGVSLPTRGLAQSFSTPLTIPKNATLQGGDIQLTVQGTGNGLTTQNLTGAQNLHLTTTGANGAITAGALNTPSVVISSQGNVTVNGSIQTTTSTAISGGAGDTVSLQAVTAGTGVTLAADTFVLSGNVMATTGDVSLTKTTLGSPLVLGNGGDLNAAGLLRLQAPAGEVILGTGTTGGIQLVGNINLTSSGTLNYALNGSAGGVTFSGAGPVLSLPSNGRLRISAGTGAVTGSATTAVAGSNAGLRIDSAGSVNLLTDIGFYGPVSTAISSGGITMANVGSVSMSGAFNAGTGNVSVRTLSGNLTLATTVAGGTIQLGAARNFNNQAGPRPFTNRNGGRTLVYSYGQGYDSPYNFAGLEGFGVAFGRGFGSMVGSGNMLIYSSYAQVALDFGVVYNEMFAGNSVSSLLAMDSNLFRSINWLGTPKAQPGGYIDYMLYPQRVEPAGSTLPPPTLSRLERELGRPPTVEELAADAVRTRQSRLMRTGAVLERSSFDERREESVETIPQERADREGEEAYPVEGQVPQAAVPTPGTVPTAENRKQPGKGDQAAKSPVYPPRQSGPSLRRGSNRAIALREEGNGPGINDQTAKILEEERVRAEVGTARPVAGQIK